MSFVIKRAVRQQRKFKGCLCGPSGSGKTTTALELALGLVGREGRICLIDSEKYSSTLYSDKYQFDVLDLSDPDVENYIAAIKEVVALGYDALIIDSLSHAWESVIERVDAAASGGSRNSWEQWGKVGTPIFKRLIATTSGADIHVIATMRSKTEWTQEEYTDRNGNKKTKPVKVGLAPVFRAGSEYEFDVVANLDPDHNMSIEKTRIPFLDGRIFNKPNAELGAKIAAWLSNAEPAAPKPLPVAAAAVAPPRAPEAPAPHERFDAHAAPLTNGGGDDEVPAFWAIETRESRHHGKTLAEIDREDPQYIAKVARSAKALAKFSEADRRMLVAHASRHEGRRG